MSLAMSIPLRVVVVPQPDTTADEEAEKHLVDRCLAGERDAFAPLVRRYGPGLFAFCSRMVGSAVGEELAQETFARAWSNLGSFRNDARLKQWLYRIALNLCRDHLKSGKAREGPAGTFEGALEPIDGRAGPEDRALGREAIASLQRAIERLTPKYKEAFLLKHIENLSYEEIREIVHMPVPALKVRVFRAREMLKQMMAEELGGEP